jgi:hypothetical protein
MSSTGDGYTRIRGCGKWGSCHLQPKQATIEKQTALHGVTSYKIVLIIVASLRTSNPVYGVLAVKLLRVTV